ncbi:unnamed protein product [Rotaria magnacalcarata]|nr:unnamed protein product [Rotaria magnacalcarata]CAF4025785.1 unnamed protein product [Rotaria magnacalcarata]
MIPSDILYSYFPFDPYVLKRSSIFIRPIYNDYREENDDITTTKESEDTNGQDLDDGDDMLTSMMMSTTPGSFDPIEQMSSLSTSFKNIRNPPSILPFGRSPGFRNI